MILSIRSEQPQSAIEIRNAHGAVCALYGHRLQFLRTQLLLLEQGSVAAKFHPNQSVLTKEFASARRQCCAHVCELIVAAAQHDSLLVGASAVETIRLGFSGFSDECKTAVGNYGVSEKVRRVSTERDMLALHILCNVVDPTIFQRALHRRFAGRVDIMQGRVRTAAASVLQTT